MIGIILSLHFDLFIYNETNNIVGVTISTTCILVLHAVTSSANEPV